MKLNHSNLAHELITLQMCQSSDLLNQIITIEGKKRNMPHPMDFTKTPVNKNEVHATLKGVACSIVNNVPMPKITNSGSM